MVWGSHHLAVMATLLFVTSQLWSPRDNHTGNPVMGDCTASGASVGVQAAADTCVNAPWAADGFIKMC